MKKKKADDVKNIHSYYKELLDQKDKLIEELKQENEILLKLSLKQGEKNKDLLDRIEQKFK